jgi:hypothetical protein
MPGLLSALSFDPSGELAKLTAGSSGSSKQLPRPLGAAAAAATPADPHRHKRHAAAFLLSPPEQSFPSALPSRNARGAAATGKRGHAAVEWYIKLFLGVHFADNLA